MTLSYRITRTHTAHSAVNLYHCWEWEVLSHLPHSLELSLCDYDSVTKMKEPLRDIRFQTIPEVLLTLRQSGETPTEQELLLGYYDFHIAGNEL
ncbi:hypothetical protein L9F63_007151 [Diploptera punctata]|uniref:Uncharacterized protein n=1 Tax=Diploptera punctata TaxID=6984 RepID=A0AAD7Z8U6_DIPPU|nr:hypothetical protein L9F63_007151 [Diploptera punctata]